MTAQLDKPNCKECSYRITLARLCDIHIWYDDCDQYGTELCKAMNDLETVERMRKAGYEI